MRARAKCVRPTPALVVGRARLFARLDEARSHPVLWLQGPPGSGKTTLLATYVKARRLRCLWLRLDPADAEPATFLDELAAAVRQEVPGARLPRFGPEYLLGLDAFFRTFFRRLFDALPSPVLLVFDDCHAIPAAAPLFAFLREGLAEVAQGCCAALLSRTSPPPPLASLQASGALEFVGADELKLTPGEVESVARRRGVTDAAQVSALVQAVEGWAAGIVLLVAAARGRADPLSEPVASPQTFEYFASEVFDRMDGAAQRVLLETALLPWVDAGIAEARLSIAGAGALLAGLARDGYFTVRLGHAGSRYQYHPLFHAFLRRRAGQQLPPERLASLRRAAATTLAEARDEGSAVALLRDAGAWPELADLLVRCGPALLDAGRAGPLAEWLALLPEELLASSARLRYLRGLVWLGADPLASRTDLTAALDAFEVAGDATGAYLSWAALAESIFFATMLEPFDACLERLDRLRAAYPMPSSPDVSARVRSSAFLGLMSRRARNPKLVEWLTGDLEPAASEPRARVMAGMATLTYDVNCSGRLGHARVVLDEIAPLAGEADPASAVGWRSSEAIFRYATGDAEGCIRTAEEALAFAAATGARQWDFLLTAELAWGAAMAGRFDLLDQALARLTAAYRPSRPMEGAWLHQARSNAAVARRDRGLAYEEGRTARACAEQAGCEVMVVLAQACEATAASLGGAAPGQGPSLEAALAAARQCGCRFAEHHALMGLAARQRREGGADLDARLRDLFGLSRETGYRCAVCLLPDELADLCAAALERDIEPECVRAYVVANRLSPPAWAHSVEAWPWELSVRVLGRFAIDLAGERREASGERSRAFDLLALVVALGGSDVAGGRLAAELWPDSEGDAAHHALDTALHRLRKALGGPDLVVHAHGRVGLASGRCWTDLSALERRLGELERAAADARLAAGAALPTLAAAVLQAYRPLLPGIDSPAVRVRRRSLDQHVRRAVGSAAAALDHAARREDAAALRQALSTLAVLED